VSGIATDGILLRYNYNGSAYADGPTASGTSGTFDFTPSSSSGTYCFYTIATDNAGNVESPPDGADGDGCTVFSTPPVAADDGYSTAEDTSLTVATPGVLGNDSDADDDALMAVLVSTPTSGTLAFDADGSFVYTPTLDFNGVVTFTYRANDGTSDSNAATVTITVTPVNDAPTFTSVPVTNAAKGVAYTYDVTAADVDNAAADLTITAPVRPGWLTLTDNGNGTATLNGIPTEANIGDHPVVLQVFDGASSATQSFTITVNDRKDYYIYLPMILRNYSVSAYYSDKRVAAMIHIAR
jgi:VCBS repeat-containing protein